MSPPFSSRPTMTDVSVLLRKAPPQNMSHPPNHLLFFLPTSSTLISCEAIPVPYHVLSCLPFLAAASAVREQAYRKIPCGVDIALIADLFFPFLHTPKSGHEALAMLSLPYQTTVRCAVSTCGCIWTKHAVYSTLLPCGNLGHVRPVTCRVEDLVRRL